jgi:exodeoxyribonuclease VII small subunit
MLKANRRQESAHNQCNIDIMGSAKFYFVAAQCEARTNILRLVKTESFGIKVEVMRRSETAATTGGNIGPAPEATPDKSDFLSAQPVLSFCFPMSTKAKPAGTELNFETAMDRLEKIVEQMESGQLPLEDLIVRYEEGMNLVKVCQERLASAEQKIEIISRNNSGKPVVKDFEPTTETTRPEPKAAAGEEHQNDEVRLF